MEERRSLPLQGAEAAGSHGITHHHGQKWCNNHGYPIEMGSTGRGMDQFLPDSEEMGWESPARAGTLQWGRKAGLVG